MNTANGIYPVHQSSLNSSLDQNGIHPSFGQGFGGPGVNPNGFDVSQFPNQNGQLPNNASPSIHQSPFQVPSVVPAKRTREEQVGASPHPPATSLGQSRSQTPQQATFNQYGGQGAGPQFSTPTPFQQHLHQSNHATPSPNPSQQQFRPPSSQPQMSSPPNFPSQAGHPGPFSQMGNPMNRMGTPQNPAQHFTPGMQPGQGLHPGAHGPMPGGPSPMGGQFPQMRPGMQGNIGQQQNDFQKQYQANLLRQRQMQGNMNQMPPGGQVNGMTPQQRAALMGGMNPNMPGRPGIPPGATQANQQETISRFMLQLERFTQQRGQPLDPNPTVCGRRLHYFQIFSLFMRYRPNHEPQGWAHILQQLNIGPDQSATAIQELRHIFERNLSGFAAQYMSEHNRKHSQQGRLPGQGSPTNDRVPRPPAPPGFPSQPAGPQAPSPSLTNRRGASIAPDGVDAATPEKTSSTLDQSSSPHPFPQGSPVQLKVSPQDDVDGKAQTDGHAHLDGLGPEKEVNKPFDPEYKPRRLEPSTYAGFNLDLLLENGAPIYEMKTLPRFEDLGPVDLHALAIGLQSGFQQEVRYALDRLAVLSQKPVFLQECEDLVDSLVELGLEQLSKLCEDVEGTPDWQDFQPYEKLRTSCREDLSGFRNHLRFGEREYGLQRSVDCLISITTILRNLSFPVSERSGFERDNDVNRRILSSPEMQSFWSKTIKLLGVKSSPLKSNADFMDIMKDLVVLLSNVCEVLIITNEDDAHTLLMFLLSFAPQAVCSGESLKAFTTYEPLKHQYLPNAVDSLAKILARDDPNRGFMKTIFHNDLTSNSKSPLPLMTQVFALAIAPIPETVFVTPPPGSILRLVEKRKPSISQGILILDILSTLLPLATNSSSVPRSDTPCLQRSWLESDDGWVTRLIHLVIVMGLHDAHSLPDRHPMTREPVDTGRGYQSITQRALSMIRRLLESADKVDRENNVDEANLMSTKILKLLPLEDMNFSALMIPRFDSETLKCLSALNQLAS